MTGEPPLFPSSLKRATAPVYHYTSSAGLLGITQRGELWASEAASLNDLAEIRQGWDYVRNWLTRQPKSEGTEYLQGLSSDPLQGQHEVFVLCGSTAGDDANQWRLYGDGGSGYAVGLDPSVQLVAVSDVPEKEDRPRFGTSIENVVTTSPWLHVLYDETAIDTALTEILDYAIKELDGFDTNYPEPDHAEHMADVLREHVYEGLARVAHLIKSPGFRGENEVRVVTTFFWTKDQVRYRPGPHGVVGYVVLTGNPDGHSASRVLRPSPEGERAATTLPIESVRLGPLLHAEHLSTVCGLLRQSKHHSTDVRLSDVPLR